LETFTQGNGLSGDKVPGAIKIQRQKEGRTMRGAAIGIPEDKEWVGGKMCRSYGAQPAVCDRPGAFALG
jgi:hypothetical protein